MTASIWVWVLSWVAIGYLASSNWLLRREIRDYRALMLEATAELRECARVIEAADSAIRGPG